MRRKGPHGRNPSAWTEESFKEAPTVSWNADEIQGKLAKR
jgi:hypothetical protein